MPTVSEQTPYLHLNLDGNEELNRNWALIDDMTYRLAAAVVETLIGPGMITQTMLAKPSVGTPELFDKAVTTSKLATPTTPLTGQVLAVDASGNLVWITPAAATASYWADDTTNAILSPVATRSVSMPIGQSLLFGNTVAGFLCRIMSATGGAMTLMSNGTLAAEVAGVSRLTIAANTPAYFPGGLRVGATTFPLTAGHIDYSGGHFRGYNGSAWVNLDDTGGGGAAIWTDDGSVITPANTPRILAVDSYNVGVGSLDYGTSYRIRHVGSGNTAIFCASTPGRFVGIRNSAPTEALHVTGGILMSAALAASPADGTLQYTGSTFQGRIAGAWVDIPGAGGGGGAPSGPAGGDLTGTYPNPQLGSGVIVDADISFSAGINWSKMTANGSVGGDLGGTMPNPTVSAAAKSKWTVSGSTITPTDATKAEIITGPTGTVVRSHFQHVISQGAVVGANRNYTGTLDDNTKPSWDLNLRVDSADLFSVRRAPAGVTSAATLLTVDAAGKLVVPGDAATGNALVIGQPVPRGRLFAHPVSGQTCVSWNGALASGLGSYVQDDVAKPSWFVQVGGTDQTTISRVPAGQTAQTDLLTLSNVGTLTLPGDAASSIQVMGTQTVKARLIASNAANWTAWSINTNSVTGSQDDAAKVSWDMLLRADSDQFQIRRRAAGGTLSFPLVLANPGSLTLGGTQITLANYGFISSTGSPSAPMMELNANYAQPVAGRSALTIRVDTTADQYAFIRQAPNGGAVTFPLTVDSAGNLFIGGTVGQKASGTTWSNPSDQRIKKDVTDYTRGLAEIRALRPVSFHYNGFAGTRDEPSEATPHWSMIADEVELVMPECVGSTAAKDGDTDITLKSLDQSNMILALINAVKEISTRLEALESKVA